MRFDFVIKVSLCAAFCAGCGGGAADTDTADEPGPLAAWKLPRELREISGLALSADERLFAVTDEIGIIHEIDWKSGRITKAFAVGDPALRRDFEGIAALGDRLWLMDSDGELYSFREGGDREHVDFRSFDTALEDHCEFEGLAADASRQVLLLVCKASRKKSHGLRLYEFDVAAEHVTRRAEIDLPEAAIADAVGSKGFNPSGLALDGRDGSLLVVAARQRAVIRLARDAATIDVIMRLDKNRHRQAEGIEITQDGRMLIADEGGNGRARIAVYRIR